MKIQTKCPKCHRDAEVVTFDVWTETYTGKCKKGHRWPAGPYQPEPEPLFDPGFLKLGLMLIGFGALKDH